MNETKVNVIVIVIAVFLVFSLSACQKDNITLNTNESFFSDFKVEDDLVYIYCTLEINNSFKTEKNIQLSANLKDDKENGLLKESTLSGYLPDLKTSTIELDKGSNLLDVVFVGEFAGKNQKVNRLLPDITISIIE